jgi:hypothetical protein
MECRSNAINFFRASYAIREGLVNLMKVDYRLFTELEKIKMMTLPDSEKIITEITKRQREILDALQMCA